MRSANTGKNRRKRIYGRKIGQPKLCLERLGNLALGHSDRALLRDI